MNRLLAVATLIAVLASAALGAQPQQKQQQKKKADPNDNKGNTPFFLQDPYDQTCLGPNGFTVCDERSLWVLTRRAGKKNTYSLVSLLNPSPYGMCLERKNNFFGLIPGDRVGMGLCSKSGSKNWDFSFVDKQHVKLSSGGQCLVRGKKTYKNSMSLQNCKDGEFIPLVYHPTSVHEAGFYLKAADGTCFDGSKFRTCTGRGSESLLWGIGVKYIGGKANRYFFNFSPEERGKCIVARGSKVEKGLCTANGALRWGLADGKLSAGNGKMCLARNADDTGVMVKCSDANEFIVMDIPTVYTEEDIANMLKNQDKLSPEEKKNLAQVIKQHSYAHSA
jgi:hypothetical protein